MTTGRLNKTIKEWIALSKQSNAFLVQYPSFHFFESSFGLAAYVDSPGSRVGALEPFVAPEDMRSALREFSAATQLDQKSAIIFPVSEGCAKIAKELGWRTLQIGVEPWYELKSLRISSDRLSVAKRLSARKAVVEEFRPEKLDPRDKAQLDAVMESWIRTRKTAPLDFLNQVRPWDFSSEKRYFLIRQQTLIYAFIAAIPVAGRKGWYFVDIPRAPDSPVGAMELLMLEAMRILRESGSLEVTLGISPLAELPDASGYPRFSAERFLSWIYRKSDSLPYNFRSLWEFKQKLGPTNLEKCYLIMDSKRFSLKTVLNLLFVFFPKRRLGAITEGLRKGLIRFNLHMILERILGTRAVPRPYPIRISEWAGRVPITLALVVTIASVYFSVPFAEGEFYTWGQISIHPINTLVLAGLHHINDIHLLINGLTGLIFCGLLEVLGGSLNTLLVLSLCWVLTNPLTTMTLGPLLSFNPELLKSFLTDQDRGASLGIFGCIGGLTLFLSNRLRLCLFSLVAVGSIAVSLTLHSFLVLNHIVALVLGSILIRLRVK